MTPDPARQRDARRIVEHCLVQHGKFPRAEVAKAFDRGWTAACVECIAEALEGKTHE